MPIIVTRNQMLNNVAAFLIHFTIREIVYLFEMKII